MANNFNDAQVSLSDATLTDIYTASNKSLVIAGTISNTGGTAINVALKKYDNSKIIPQKSWIYIKDKGIKISSSSIKNRLYKTNN